MRILAQKITHEPIDLTDAQVNSIAIQRLQLLIAPGEHLKSYTDGIYLVREINRPHGGPTVEKVRKATTLDMAVIDVLARLRWA